MTRTAVAALMAALAMGACAELPGMSAAPTPAATAPVQYVRDIHSYARPEIARVTHVDLDLTADFERKVLSGTAALDVTAEPGAGEIILDVRDLDIHAVRTADGPLEYTLGAHDPILGQPLTIALPFEAGRIFVDYSTRPGAEALQWLTPAQTAGGEKPYLFSQGQAILTRTWIPTQDSPGIRQTYSARIVAPAGLKAVMAAEMLTPEGEATPNGRAWRFRMTQPIPPYLIALGVGDLAFAPLGQRTGVYTEPSM